MNIFTSPRRIIVTCSKRLTPYLEREVTDLGFIPESTFATGWSCTERWMNCIKLNLNLRCASQVHYSLKEMEINHPDELYRQLVDYPWEDLFVEWWLFFSDQ